MAKNSQEKNGKNSQLLSVDIEKMAQAIAEEFLSTGISPVKAIAEQIVKTKLTGQQKTAMRDAVVIRAHQIIADRVLTGDDDEVRQIGYKVVYSRDNKYPVTRQLKPVTRHALQSIRYAWGEITEPSHSGPLAVFKDLESAEQWASKRKNRKNLHIYLVRYEPSDGDRAWKKLPPMFVKGEYHGYYAKKQGITFIRLSNCPPGTVLAESVELLAEVPYHEAAPQIAEKATAVA